MNQSEQVENLLRAGYQKGVVHDGFICLFKRETGQDKNYVYPEYHDVTIFPNGRMADGEHRKWTKIRKRNAEKAKREV